MSFAQADIFVKEYLNNVCEDNMPLSGEAYLYHKSLLYSWELLEEHLPLELATRNTASVN
jgi:hypothetical protein